MAKAKRRKRSRPQWVKMDTFWGDSQRVSPTWVSKGCPYCGETFITDNLDQKFCSTQCRFGTKVIHGKF